SFFFFTSRSRHTRSKRDWSSDVCSPDLRPGRLDVKIKIERPDRSAAGDIFRKYLTTQIPIAESETRHFSGDAVAAIDAMIAATRSEERRVGKECRSRGGADH